MNLLDFRLLIAKTIAKTLAKTIAMLALVTALVITIVIAMPPAVFASAADEPQPVSDALMEEIIGAIVKRGYATGTTTNQARFVADFLLALARHPEVGQRGRFWIDPEDFLDAWTRATGTPSGEIPNSIANVARFKQRFHVDPAPEGIEFQARSDSLLRAALAVCVTWPSGPDQPNSYEYLDTMSDPEVRMRHDREISYLLLDTGDMVAYEHIAGVAGQPVSGGLGTLFSLLGMARIHSTRLAIAEDGIQVNFTQGRKLFGFKTVATIQPNGRAQRGVNDDRPDLVALENHLNDGLKVQFRGPFPGPCR